MNLFWINPDIYNQGFTKEYYLTKIQPEILSIEIDYQNKKILVNRLKGLRESEIRLCLMII